MEKKNWYNLSVVANKRNNLIVGSREEFITELA
jgi:hypothetical protein